MESIGKWLAVLGLSEYARRFAENDIDSSVLRDLTDQDLKEIGVSLEHRRKMLQAIAELQGRGRADRALAAVARHKDAERRQLTVMFCDLVGSTALSARLDPEDMRDIIGAYHHCCAEQITKARGFVDKYMGDGVLAYFGYPQADEHDAERAVRAGLALIDAVPKLETAAGIPLQVRVGIATGLVIVGDLFPGGAAQEQTVVSETHNLAARLQALAEPGAIVISASTHRLTGGLFEYHDLGTAALKRFAETVPAWQVLGASAAESRFEALRATMTPLVGRDEEIELLLRRWQQTKAGEGSVVLISGEPGIGKSRIAQTVLEQLSAEPHTRMHYYCSPHHQDSALHPIITQLGRAAGFRREDSAERRLDKLEAVVAQATNGPGEAIPLLADLLSISYGDRYPKLSLAPRKRKEKTLGALIAQVEGLTARQPVLIAFEDVHWSDPTTREWLDLLIDRVPTLRVLVIITFRPEFTPPWIGRPHVILLSLSRLLPQQGAAMIRSVTGGKALPKEIADKIVDRTDGVPLFVEELTKTVVESGILTETGERYTVTGPVAPLSIPTTLYASLLARLDRLAPMREVAQIAAALGRSFSHELISAVAPIPLEQLNDALVQLMGAELIFRRGTPPDEEYTFKHTLVQEAAYSTLLRSRRQQIHARIAATLESQFPEIAAAQPQVLAQHYAKASLNEKAVNYWLKAGRQAIARGLMTEAVAHARNGLDVLSGMPNSTLRQEQELDLQITLGKALMATKGFSASEPGEAFARARQLCEQLSPSPQLGRVLYGQWLCRVTRGDLDQAEQHAERLRQLGEAQNYVMWKCLGSRVSGVTCFHLGRFIEGRAYLQNALSLQTNRTFTLTSEDPDAMIASFLSLTLLCLGRVDQARLRRDEALAEARRVSPHTLANTLYLAWLGAWVKEGAKSAYVMLSSADELLAISREQGFPTWSAAGNCMRGWCLSAMGQADEGIEQLLQGLATWRNTGVNLTTPFLLMTLAEVHGISGQPEQGLHRLTEAAQLVESTQERWAEAEMHRLRGTLLLTMNQHAAAEDSFRHALAVSKRQSAKLLELHATLDLARLWRNQGRRAEARDLLVPICNWFSEGVDTAVLRDAQALLDSTE